MGSLTALSEIIDTVALLSALGAGLVERIQAGEQVFFSNAVVGGRFLLRACIVNFRTAMADIEAVPGIVTRLGRALDREMRAGGLRTKA